MARRSPQQMLAMTRQYAHNLEKARRRHVAVGLPAENVGGKVYGDGWTVIANGIVHEFGIGVPPRSFLRVPFQVRAADMTTTIAAQFRDVAESGKDADTALGTIGIKAMNISQGAFTTQGYGTWPDITEETKDRKGSSRVLFDKGILQSSITYVVR